jgi:hypothetical protein
MNVKVNNMTKENKFENEKKFCGIPERERNPGHPANPPLPIAHNGVDRPEHIDRRRPVNPYEDLDKAYDRVEFQMHDALMTFEQFAKQSGNRLLAELANETIDKFNTIVSTVGKSEEWWDSLKAAGAVNTATPGIYNQSIRQPQEEEEEEYEIIPEEADFWRD